MKRLELSELLSMYYQIRELIKVKFIHVNGFVPANIMNAIETEYKRLCDIEENYEETRSLNWLRDQMDCNSEGAYFNRDAFRNKTDAVCYIPANAEDLDDVFTYKNLRSEVISWLKQDNTVEWLVDRGEKIKYVNGYPFIKPYIDEFLNQMFDYITWEFPSTYLDGLLDDEYVVF